MAPIITIFELRRFLISSQLLSPQQWSDSGADEHTDMESALRSLEGSGFLTSFQTHRIRKGQTDGIVLGNYKLQYRNASGSFARVYRASTLNDSRVVALKLLRDRWASDPEHVSGFHREARICQTLKHPNIVPILDVGQQGNFHYFTMEFIEGGNLRDIMRIRKVLKPAEAARCMYEICAGLEYALSHSVTHRDLKLTNVLMTSRGQARLVDFGLAGADSPSMVGTSDDVHRALEYASLERGTNAPDNDPRSDLFFAGAILYELLSGQSPWPRTRDREERKQLSRYTNTPSLSSIRPDLPRGLAKICETLMQVSPSDRYQSPTEVIADLQVALQDLGAWTENDQQTPVEAPKRGPFRLLVVDSIRKRIQALKDYFSRHGFKTEFVTSPQVAMERLKGSKPPDGILILADNSTDQTIEGFPQMQAYGRSKRVPCLAVFPEEVRARVDGAIRSTKYGATEFQPATLRTIRTHFESIGR